MKKRLRIAAMALGLVMTVSSVAFAAELPTDLEGNHYEAAVKTLFENGVVTGDTDGKYHPENNLTRAQACIMLVKAIDPQSDLVKGTATQSAGKADFSDLSGYSWAEGYIAYAVEYGIVKGYPDGTFKPSVNVSTNEMVTMVLRASGYTDDKIEGTWPAAHLEKAESLGILEKLEENYPEVATKGMAAQMIANQLTELQKNAPVVEEKPQGTKADVAKGTIDTASMTYKEGKFDDDLTSYNGIKLSKSVKIYTYGSKKEYSASMSLPTKAEEYRMDTVYKFKDAKTPAWYTVEDGKITAMILPMDTGFTGNVYCVVNDTTTEVNANGKKVSGFETLTATKKITWFAEEGKSLTIPGTAGDGELIELKVSDGEVISVGIAGGSHRGKVFNELTSGSWDTVSDYSNEVIRVASGLIAVRSNASVYVWDDSKQEYKAGSLSSIRNAPSVRAYDVSDDDTTQADVVIVQK